MNSIVTFNVDSDSQWNIVFANCTKQRTEMNHPINAVHNDNLLKSSRGSFNDYINIIRQFKLICIFILWHLTMLPEGS